MGLLLIGFKLCARRLTFPVKGFFFNIFRYLKKTDIPPPPLMVI